MLCNILNMQLYATSAAGQTYSYSNKSVKGGGQYLHVNENISLSRHRKAIPFTDVAGLTSRIGKIC